MKKSLAFLLAMIPVMAPAQGLKLDSLDKLAAKASDTVKVSLDGGLLRLASKFLRFGVCWLLFVTHFCSFRLVCVCLLKRPDRLPEESFPWSAEDADRATGGTGRAKVS